MTELTEQFIKQKNLTREEVVQYIKDLQQQQTFIYFENNKFDFNHLPKNNIYKSKLNKDFLLIENQNTLKRYVFRVLGFNSQALFQVRL
jgi:uncharacterized HAD superfamily protein